MRKGFGPTIQSNSWVNPGSVYQFKPVRIIP